MGIVWTGQTVGTRIVGNGQTVGTGIVGSENATPTAGCQRSGTDTDDGSGREIAVGNEISRGFPFPSRPGHIFPSRLLSRVPLFFFPRDALQFSKLKRWHYGIGDAYIAHKNTLERAG